MVPRLIGMKKDKTRKPWRKLSIATATLRRLDTVALGDAQGGTAQTDAMGCYSDTTPIPDSWWNCSQ